MNAKIVPIDRRMDTHHEAFPSFENVTLLAYMQLADSKASVFLAMTTSAIAYLIARFGLAWLKIEKFSWHPVLLYVSVALLAVSAAYAMAVIVPRLAGSHGSVVHFRSVSRRATHQLYADDVLALSPAELFHEEIAYCHELSRVCTRKYRLLDLSLTVGVIGYAAFLATLIFI